MKPGSLKFVYLIVVFMTNDDYQCCPHLSITVNGRKTVLSLSFCEYCFNVYTVIRKSCVFASESQWGYLFVYISICIYIYLYIFLYIYSEINGGQ